MPRQALIAEDDVVSRQMLQTLLEKWGYEVVAAPDGTVAWEILQKLDSPTLAILDWMMPGVDGTELCRRIRRMDDRNYIYVILLSTKDLPEHLIEGMEAGADDYLVKPIQSAEFRARLSAGNRILDLHGQLLDAQEALRDKATHDPLTGLWNRSATLDAFERDLSRAQRESAPLGVLMADLDYFKRINDTYGHDAGDEVLRQVAKRMLSAIRTYDTLGRYGGEEFLIVAPGCDAEATALLADRIRRCIAADPVCTGKSLLPLTLSIGTAISDNHCREASLLIRAADQALYRAKNAGRNRVETSASAANLATP
jgi:diguanylate cyclase (GGDEF)-like protein